MTEISHIKINGKKYPITVVLSEADKQEIVQRVLAALAAQASN